MNGKDWLNSQVTTMKENWLENGLHKFNGKIVWTNWVEKLG